MRQSILRYLLGRRRPILPPPLDRPARVEEGARLYVFGDVHGRVDLLSALVVAIDRDIARLPPARILIVGLGDYIDRGPQSKAVIDVLVGITSHELVAVRGNHEQMLLDFLEDPQSGAAWFSNGAIETLRSYDIDVKPARRISRETLRETREALARTLPVSHVQFLRRLPTLYVSGDYFFVHAGARPGTPLDQQSRRDLLWIRDGFVDGDGPFEKLVVHGHTPVTEPYLGQHRINLDTGAVFTNRLSCLVLEGTTRRLLAG